MPALSRGRTRFVSRRRGNDPGSGAVDAGTPQRRRIGAPEPTTRPRPPCEVQRGGGGRSNEVQLTSGGVLPLMPNTVAMTGHLAGIGTSPRPQSAITVDQSGASRHDRRGELCIDSTDRGIGGWSLRLSPRLASAVPDGDAAVLADLQRDVSGGASTHPAGGLR